MNATAIIFLLRVIVKNSLKIGKNEFSNITSTVNP